MADLELINYLSTLRDSMRKDGLIAIQISDETINIILTELLNNKNQIEHLNNCVMSEDQVQQIMKDTCHQMMTQQKRIFEINGALEAIQELEVNCNDAATLKEMFKLAMHYKKLLAECA